MDVTDQVRCIVSASRPFQIVSHSDGAKHWLTARSSMRPKTRLVFLVLSRFLVSCSLMLAVFLQGMTVAGAMTLCELPSAPTGESVASTAHQASHHGAAGQAAHSDEHAHAHPDTASAQASDSADGLAQNGQNASPHAHQCGVCAACTLGGGFQGTVLQTPVAPPEVFLTLEASAPAGITPPLLERPPRV